MAPSLPASFSHTLFTSRFGDHGNMTSAVQQPLSMARRQPLAAKVPEITALFWLVKVLTTGVGEATSDFLGNTNLALAAVLVPLGFGISLWLQFRSERYAAGYYWFAVAMIAVFGTVGADGLHVGLDIPYAVSTVIWGLVVAVVFWRWHKSEGTLDIHSITTRRRETYYWVTVFSTFALGTAAGDFTAVSLNLGFFPSAVLFAAIIALPAAGFRWLSLNPVVAFWSAYVLTRPLGASLADWLGKPHDLTGLGFGDGTVVLVGSVLIAGVVAYLGVTRRDVQTRYDPRAGKAAASEVAR